METNITAETEKIKEAGSKLVQSSTAISQMRVQDLLKILGNFEELREQGKSRGEYVSELKQAACDFYGYNEQLMDMFFDLFSPQEAIQFFEANETPRPLVIRANTLKTKRRDLAKILIGRGVNLEPLAEWTKVGLKINDSKVPIGATPEYLAGYYILQSPSSFLPVMALCPQPDEVVVDMAAAPGGKTTYLAQLMKNRGVIIANDSQKDRTKALYANCQRLGVTNVVITNYDGRKMPQIIQNVDRVLLDSPCSGMGLISRDPSMKSQKNFKEIKALSKLQKELILAAIDCVNPHSKTGGYLVYSTCSITVEEDEAVVEYALRHRYVKIVDSGLAVGVPGVCAYRKYRFTASMKLARRIYPHVHNMDGFFVCKLRKFANGVRQKKYDVEEQPKKSEGKKGKRQKPEKAKGVAKSDEEEKEVHEEGEGEEQENPEAEEEVKGEDSEEEPEDEEPQEEEQEEGDLEEEETKQKQETTKKQKKEKKQEKQKTIKRQEKTEDKESQQAKPESAKHKKQKSGSKSDK